MFKVNNKDPLGVVLVSLLLTLNIFCSSVSIVNFEQVNAGWEACPNSNFLVAKQINSYFSNNTQ